jgi:hypothetical protein
VKLKLKKLLLGAAVAAPVLAAVACSSPPTHGYVYSIDYEPASSAWWPGHYYSSCSGYRHRSCYRSYSPGYTEYIPEEWRLELCQKRGVPSKANACGWRDVDEVTYHSVRLGQYYTTVAS